MGSVFPLTNNEFFKLTLGFTLSFSFKVDLIYLPFACMYHFSVITINNFSNVIFCKCEFTGNKQC